MKHAAAILFSFLFSLAGPVSAAEGHKTPEPVHAHQGEAHDEGHDDEGHEGGEHSDHEGHAEGVRALHAWIRATSDKTALLFVEIENTSDRDILITGAETDVAESVELVGFQLKDGETHFIPLPPVPLKAGQEMVLTPNGLALRLNGLKRSFGKGEEFEIEIEFDFGHLEMHAQVEDANATRHSHAGHQH
ncbi:copper chaperone PCu(A)C [Roseibium marinum]|uniref:Copper chaperone PCu(A)C n=1 Tax=Roseibium marinum TaxID=281252 RepID=A0A2S3ULC4_9HYPH|nr:copper chaperone PCu(A)C [Roseibium marinum]POF28517.1 hypothetical protein CLV41_11380 [Roseibium marinum]